MSSDIFTEVVAWPLAKVAAYQQAQRSASARAPAALLTSKAAERRKESRQQVVDEYWQHYTTWKW